LFIIFFLQRLNQVIEHNKIKKEERLLTNIFTKLFTLQPPALE